MSDHSAAAVRTLAISGDSRSVSALTIDATGYRFQDRGYLWSAIGLSGCNVPIVAVSAVVGRKVPFIGAALFTEIFPYNPTDIVSLGFVNSIEDYDVSSDAAIQASALTLFAECKLMYDEILDRGIFLHLVSECANTSLTTAQKKLIPPVVALQQKYCAERPGLCTFTNIYRATVDPTSAVGNFIPAMTIDNIHFTTFGAYTAGNLIAPSLASRFPQVLPAMSQTDSRTVDAGSNQLVVNPLMTGTGGTITSAGITGTVPTGYSISVAGTGFAGDTTVVSIIPASDGIGFAMRIALNTSTANARRFTIKGSNVASLFVAGRQLYLTGRIANTVAGQMKSYSISFRYDAGASVSSAGYDTNGSPGALPVFPMRQMTTPTVKPANAATIEPQLFIETMAAIDTTSVIIIEGFTFRENPNDTKIV